MCSVRVWSYLLGLLERGVRQSSGRAIRPGENASMFVDSVISPSFLQQLAYERDVAIKTEYLMQKQRRELGWRDGTPPVRGGKLYKGLTWQTK